MWRVDDLSGIAAELIGRGMSAARETKHGPEYRLEGLRVEQDFFPLWELNLPENQGAASAFDFQRIKERRAVDWSEEPPNRLPQNAPEYTGVTADITPRDTPRDLAAIAKEISRICRGIKVHVLLWSAVRKRDPGITESRFRAMLAPLTEIDTDGVLSGAIQPKHPLLLVVFDGATKPPGAAELEMRLFSIQGEVIQPGPKSTWRSLSMN